MNSAGNSIWIVVLLAVLGVLAVPGARALSAENPRAEATAAGSSSASIVFPNSVEPVSGAPKPSPPKLAALTKALAEGSVSLEHSPSLQEVVAELRAKELRISAALVAVPDPGGGHMAVYFDQAIDALRRGAAELGFSQDRFSLPTLPKPNARAGDRVAPPSEDPPSEPSFILFRRQGELLVAVLVLESPVLGASPSELLGALELVDTLGSPQQELALLAPFFSGSASKLGAALSSFRAANPDTRARVISGTASGATVGAAVTRNLEQISFQRTTPSSPELLQFLLDKLRERHLAFRPPRIALLSEFDTSFGAQHQLRIRANGPERVRYFAFPSSISQLRVARIRQRGDKPDSNPLSLRRTLELKLDPAEEAALDVPAPASELTTYEQELELAEQMVRICRERIDYLILIASDPVDVIFLAQESRKYCPGLTLVTLGSDQLFRHPDLRAALEGMLIASGYPLLFSLPPWRDRNLTRPFASHVAQGFFNAWVALVGGGSANGAPLPGYSAWPDADGCQGSERRRPLWLTKVAGGSFWPLATRCLATSEAVPPPATTLRPERRQARATGLARAAGTLVLGLALLHAIAALLATRGQLRRFPFVPLLRRAPALHGALQSRYLVGAHLSLGLLSALLSPGAWHAALHNQEPIPFKVFLGGGALLGTLCGAGLLVLAANEGLRLLRELSLLRRVGRANGSLHVRVVALAAIATSVILTALVAVYIVDFYWSSELERQLILTRAFDPLGMSPLAPALHLCLGYYVWSMVGLRRVRALQRFSELPPLPAGALAEEQPAAAEAKTEDEQRLKPVSTPAPALGAVLGMLHGIWWGALWRYEAAALTLLLLPAVYFFVRVLPTWEGEAYDWLLKVAFLVLYALVAIAFLHFLLLSWLLRRFLRQLAAHPMVDAYDRIAIKVSGSFGMQFGARVPSFEELQVSGYSSDLLTTLTSERFLSSTLPPEYREALAQIHPGLAEKATQVKQALAKLRESRSDEAEIENAGHQSLYLASQHLFKGLQKLWQLRTQIPVTDSFASVMPQKDLLPGGSHARVPTVALYMSAVPDTVYVWIRMAEDFVALRVATFISHVISQLRHLLTFALTAGVLLVLSVSAYPLEPARFVTVFAWALVLVVVTAALAVIVRMERNEILSRLGGSRPGRVDLNLGLISQLFVYVALPLVAVLANIFPEMRDLLFSWVGPVRQLLP